jgi:hypothetical protein
MAGDEGLTFEGFRNVRLEQFGEAAEEWRTQVRRLEDMRDPKNEMISGARQADWEGENAQVTRPFVEEQGEQFSAALNQARSLAAVCEDGYQRLRGYKTDLETTVGDAEARGLTISENGTVSHPFGNLGVTGGEGEQYAEDVAATDEEISNILQRATEADAAIAQALRDIAGDNPHRFNPVEYDSLREARRAHQDAEEAVELMELGGDLTDEELRRLDSLLEDHAGDPAFAENIALGLGAEGTLQFWADVSNSRYIRPDSEEWRMFSDLQESLGQTLGLATQSDSQQMREWEQETVDLGDDLVVPYGFQVMSGLMQHGTYGEDFLLSYGNALLQAEQEDDRFNPAGWELHAQSPRLNFEQDDPGIDPMIGFMDALGHNPDASTGFFGVEQNFNYLTQDRTWPSDFMGDGATVQDSNAGYTALGDALLAATTGQSTDEWSANSLEEILASDRRTAESAGVMEQVISLYGNTELDLLHDQPAMAESLGRMASMYMDDVNYWVCGENNTERGNAAETFSSPYPGRLGNGREEVIDFLVSLGQNEASHGIVTQGQQLYTLGVLDANLPNNSDNLRQGTEALRTAAEVRGILDSALVEQVKAEYGADSQAAQESLGQASGWVKAGVGAGIGAGVAVIPGAGVAAPIAAGAAGVFLGEFINQQVDGVVAYEGSNRNSEMTEEDFYGAGEAEIAGLVDQYFAERGGSVTSDDIDDRTNELEGAYDVGKNWSEDSGQDPQS